MIHWIQLVLGQTLRTLLSGSHPDIPSKSSTAWDFQFEAYVAAVAQLSGYQIDFAEPDIIIHDGATRLGIAAKRPRGQNGVRRNLEKAVKQINKSGLDGLIALDCSFIVADGRSLTATTLQNAALAAKTLVQEFVERNVTNIRTISFGQNVIGIIFTLHMPATLVDEEWKRATQMVSAYRWTVLPVIDSNDVRLKTVLNFTEQCQRGLFNESASAQKGT
jgi:hypothetical protein